MENFYGGRRGPKGDTIEELSYNDTTGQITVTTKSYITADDEGTFNADKTVDGIIEYVKSISYGNNGTITYTTNRNNTTTNTEWNFPANRVIYEYKKEGDVSIKDYIQSLDYEATDLGEDKTITAISETDGKIEVTASNINIASSQIKDKADSFDANDGIKVTTGKVVNAALQTLDVTGTTDFGAGNTIDTWSEVDGKVEITSRAIEITSSQVGDRVMEGTSDDSKIPTLNKVNALINALDKSTIGGDGKYIKTISETDGIINATTGNTSEFATSAQGTLANTAVQSVKISGSDTELKSGTNVVLPAAFLAKDVYDWAKEANKPTYTASEVGALPSTTKATDIGGLADSAIVTVPLSQWESYTKKAGVIYVVYDTDGSASVHVGVTV